MPVFYFVPHCLLNYFQHNPPILVLAAVNTSISGMRVPNISFPFLMQKLRLKMRLQVSVSHHGKFISAIYSFGFVHWLVAFEITPLNCRPHLALFWKRSYICSLNFDVLLCLLSASCIEGPKNWVSKLILININYL